MYIYWRNGFWFCQVNGENDGYQAENEDTD